MAKEAARRRSKEYYEKMKSDVAFKARRKEYIKKYRQENKRTEQGRLTKTYSRIKRDQSNKFNEFLSFSKGDLWDWIQSNYQEKFSLLFKNYVDSDCNRYLNPSIDRIDDYKGYTFDNMQLITWHENNIKGRNSVKNKEQCSEMAKKTWSKKVYQCTIDGEIINEYTSTREASRHLDIDSSAISKCCRNGIKSYKNIVWRYADEY